MKLYTATFSAWRDIDGQVTIQTTPAVVLAPTEEEALKTGMGGAFAAFPTSEGWLDHQVSVSEIPDGLTFENYRLNWQIHRIA